MASKLAGLTKPQTFTPEPVDQEIVEWVEREYREWAENPSKWREVTLGDADTMDAVMKDATKYVTEQRNTPLTLQRKNGYPVVNEDGSSTLVYRIRDKMARGRRSENGSAQAE